MGWFFRRFTHLQRGNQWFVAKNYERAIKHYLRHADAVPDEAATAYAKIGHCYLNINTIKEPINVAGGALKLVFQGDRASAEQYYRRALEVNPNHFAALKGLADVLSNKADEWRDVAERAIAVQSDYLLLLELGDFYRTVRKEYPQAYEFYKRANEHRPRDKDAYRKLGYICRKLNRLEEAKEWSVRLRELEKDRG
ncbi:MAG: tetratricopeptide repeat protein [Planctomycetes bacterium]|nr:tetratricopeptide repeat protein [Planctomycetota bacterium]